MVSVGYTVTEGGGTIPFMMVSAVSVMVGILIGHHLEVTGV